MARHFANTSADVVTIGNPAAIQALTSITVACWFYTDATTGARQDWVAKGLGWVLHATGAVPPTVGWDVAGGNGVTGVTGAALGAWHHACGSLTGTTAKVYLDGALDSTNAASNTLNTANTDSIFFGQDGRNGSAVVSGRVAEVGVWSRALSDAEVAALAKGVPAPLAAPGGLVGYWPLHGVSATEPDLSGQRNNGTVSGTTVAAPPPMGMLTRPRGDFWALRSAATAYTQTLSLTQATAPALSKQAGKALSLAQPQTAALTKQPAKLLSLGQPQTASLTKQASKALALAQASVASLTKQTAKLLTLGQATTASLAAIKTHLVSLAATQATLATLARATAKALSASQPSVALIGKATAKLLSASQGATAALQALRTRLVMLSASQPTVAALRRNVGKGLAATQATAAALGKGVGKALAVAQGTALSLLARGGSAVVGAAKVFFSRARQRLFKSAERQREFRSRSR